MASALNVQNALMWNRTASDADGGRETALTMKTNTGAAVAAVRAQHVGTGVDGTSRLLVEVPTADGTALQTGLHMDPTKASWSQVTTVPEMGINNSIGLSPGTGAADTLVLRRALTAPATALAPAVPTSQPCQVAVYTKGMVTGTYGLTYTNLVYGTLAFPAVVQTCSAVTTTSSSTFTLNRAGLYKVFTSVAITNQTAVTSTHFEIPLSWSPAASATAAQNYGFHTCANGALQRHERHSWVLVTTPGVALSVAIVPNGGFTNQIREWGVDSQPMHTLVIQYVGSNATA